MTKSSSTKTKQVIVASGPYTQPLVPSFANKLAANVTQLHSSNYKNSGQLNKSDVFVIGGGNSATQLAEELHAHCKHVTLISARMPWFLPKTILGVSSYWWFYLSGILHAGSQNPISKYVRNRGDGIIGTNALKLIKNGSINHIASRVIDVTSYTLELENVVVFLYNR